ncbi:hypothetical protein [Roseicella aerolata]|uniref:Uncharacterized protein n=1 Tax=Roseicella aerolata TaxID=2883479 RepID=A0A9X1LCH2_9PROT|nr:hypothetical protein [Roseicella aerolata]MCB4823597.1 hypothetical protein [Roseicella aerolata]
MENDSPDRPALAGADMRQVRELYASSNGDRWFLARDPGSGRVFVRHEPNAASGGRKAEFEIGEFLARGGQGPEHQALLRLIGSLVGDPARG